LAFQLLVAVVFGPSEVVSPQIKINVPLASHQLRRFSSPGKLPYLVESKIIQMW